MKDITLEETNQYDKSINKLYKSTNINIHDLLKIAKENKNMSYSEEHGIFLIASKVNTLKIDNLKNKLSFFKKDRNDLSINNIYIELLNPDKTWTTYLDKCLYIINEECSYYETFNKLYPYRADLLNLTNEQKKIYVIEKSCDKYVQDSIFFPKEITKDFIKENYIYYVDIHTCSDLDEQQIDFLYNFVLGILVKNISEDEKLNTIINSVSYSC